VTFILDTNVVSELRKVPLGKAYAPVARWADSVDISDLYVSVITVHELEVGVLRLERRDRLGSRHDRCHTRRRRFSALWRQRPQPMARR
jgi:predicted nucleic acid-binding protein